VDAKRLGASLQVARGRAVREGWASLKLQGPSAIGASDGGNWDSKGVVDKQHPPARGEGPDVLCR
jgi:Tfp pilus assembly protein FimT